MTEAAAPNYYDKVEIHEREFQRHSVQHRIYLVPVDEDEEERLVLQHNIFHEVFSQRFFFPQIDYPERILDCGYGQGTWAVQMATMYSESEVTALDIFPADLPEQPDNLELQIWDLNESLTPTYERDHYDLIQSRCVGPGIRRGRWRSYVRDLARLLRRDGWVQMVEYYYNFQSDSGRLNDDHALHQWGRLYRGAMEELDRDPRVGRTLENKLKDTGLRHVRSRCFRIPIGNWPTDSNQLNIGNYNVRNIDSLLDSHAIWPFTQIRGWTKDQVGWLTERAKQETRDASLKLYIELYVAWGQKR